jgi:holo-[acyl-carrier-protein] synthase
MPHRAAPPTKKPCSRALPNRRGGAGCAGLGVNAGHDLSRDNLTAFLRAVPGVHEVSIGHAFVADALELGYTATTREYLRCITRGAVNRPACMIYGIGTDICDLRRIAATFERQGERFARKVLSDAEFAVWQARSARWPKRGLSYLATRFSAKEAFSKAIGLGMRMPMTWRLVRDRQPAQRQAGHRAARRAQGLVRGQGPHRPRHRDRRNRIRRELRRGGAQRHQERRMTATTTQHPRAAHHRRGRHRTQRRRPPPPGKPAGRRRDPFHPQLAGPRADDRAVRRDQGDPPRPADLRRPRRRARAALSHRRLHAPAFDARWASCGCATPCAPRKAATAAG